MRYRLVMDTKYRVSGRHIKNMKGTLVVFHDGVANSVSQDIADYAGKLYYISDILPIGEEVVAPVVVEPEPVITPEPEPEPETEPTPEPEPEPEPTPEVEVEPETEVESELVVEPEVEENLEPTAEEIQSLYDELGTWTAVADRLEVTTATLRKYREAAGLL